MGVKKYFKFKGRANRKEYWVVAMISTPLFLLGYRAGLSLQDIYNLRRLGEPIIFSNIDYRWLITGYIVFITITLVISMWLFIATVSRRCADIGISDWYSLLVLVDYINVVFVILIGCIKTDAARNPEIKAKFKKILSFFKK